MRCGLIAIYRVAEGLALGVFGGDPYWYVFFHTEVVFNAFWEFFRIVFFLKCGSGSQNLWGLK